ncbi:MAG: hypothetical protein ABSC55_13925 [Syntrophorhabdales bacterium]
MLEKYVAELKSKAKITINAELLKGEAEKGGPAPNAQQPSQAAPAPKPGEVQPTSEAPLKAEPAAKAEPQPAKEGGGVKK